MRLNEDFGVSAPIFAVAPTQITVEVPKVVAGPVNVQVLRNCGEATEQKSNVLSAAGLSIVNTNVPACSW